MRNGLRLPLSKVNFRAVETYFSPWLNQAEIFWPGRRKALEAHTIVDIRCRIGLSNVQNDTAFPLCKKKSVIKCDHESYQVSIRELDVLGANFSHESPRVTSLPGFTGCINFRYSSDCGIGASQSNNTSNRGTLTVPVFKDPKLTRLN